MRCRIKQAAQADGGIDAEALCFRPRPRPFSLETIVHQADRIRQVVPGIADLGAHRFGCDEGVADAERINDAAKQPVIHRPRTAVEAFDRIIHCVKKTASAPAALSPPHSSAQFDRRGHGRLTLQPPSSKQRSLRKRLWFSCVIFWWDAAPQPTQQQRINKCLAVKRRKPTPPGRGCGLTPLLPPRDSEWRRGRKN